MTLRLTTKQARALGLSQQPATPRKRAKPSQTTPALAAARTTAPVRLWVAALPPTVNHMYVNNGRGGKVLGDGALLFRQLVAVACQLGGYSEAPAGDLALTVRLVFPDKRRCDLDNRLKAAQDALALALGFDDSRITRVVAERAGYDKGRPACELLLEVLP